MSKHIIITGTSRGIGFEVAQLFAKNNYQVLALSRNSEPLKKLNLKNISTILKINDHIVVPLQMYIYIKKEK